MAKEKQPVVFDDEFQKKLEYLHIVAKKLFSGANRADRKTKLVGSGIEFADHRNYSPGDDFRYIDWNLYGRIDKLMLRLFEEEEDLFVYFLVDCSSSMAIGKPSKHHYALKVAAALGYVALANLDRASYVLFGDKIKDNMPPARGKARIFNILDFLSASRCEGTTSLNDITKSFVLKQKRKGLVVLISDFYDAEGYQSAIDTLRYHKFDPFVVQVTDPKEAEPDLYGDLAIVDCEGGAAKNITVSRELLKAYKKAHADYCKEIADYCTSVAVPYFRTTTALPFDELVLKIFRVGGFLK